MADHMVRERFIRERMLQSFLVDESVSPHIAKNAFGKNSNSSSRLMKNHAYMMQSPTFSSSVDKKQHSPGTFNLQKVQSKILLSN